MDIGALAAGLAGARIGQIQLSIAAKMLRMNADQAGNVVKMIESAQQNINRLANVAAGIGDNLDISA